ncbi:hypothetical protein PIB30_011462 [Stylosanthes scabra]|uniref:Uncharacterized protein n=1 Tax=Stylosanthes scabra TaxID=79078 RepID=A0ABU6R6M9_9FABA|nr:hypothetical protein [Stylosanthes scabra]
MAERFHLVTDVHQRNMHWNIQVYVIRSMMFQALKIQPPSRVLTWCCRIVRFRTIPKLTALAVVTENDLFGKIWLLRLWGKEDPRDLVTSLGKETKRMAINLQDLE